MKKVVGFGEIMLRLEPRGYLKFIQADCFNISYAGAEANVCVSLRNFDMAADYVTKLPDNDIAKACLATLRKYGVGLDKIVRGGDRIGTYYLERGASQRPSRIVYDRKYSSVSMSLREDYNWTDILADATWFHFTGITPALSETMPMICEDACKEAKRRGIVVSCDLNYRKNLWTSEQAARVMGGLVQYADVVMANEEDAEKCLGIKAAGADIAGGMLNRDGYVDVARRIVLEHGVKQVAITLRSGKSASDNNWAGMLYSGGEAYFSRSYDIHMVDRVGGGDSFSAALIYALHNGRNAQEAIEFAVAASCLKQTMEYDFNLASVADVEALMGGDESGRIQR